MCREKNFALSVKSKKRHQKSNIHSHRSNKRESEKKKISFDCKCCNKTYPSLNEFRQHLEAERKKIYSCAYCEKVYANQTGLRIHLHTVHFDAGLPFKCNICKKGFPIHYRLQEHMARHRRENQFFCETCNEVINEEAVWRNHLERHEDEEDFQCDKCILPSDKTIIPLYCELHKTRHIAPCDICNKTSLDYEHFKEHFELWSLREWKISLF